MNETFALTLSRLRKEKRISQRRASEDLGISQALLSHYENGIREPGLAFVIRACDYYHVSADYMLGRTNQRDSGEAQRDGAPAGPVAGGTAMLLRLMDKLENGAVAQAAKQYLSSAVYYLYRHLAETDPFLQEEFLLSNGAFSVGMEEMELRSCAGRYRLALEEHRRQGRPLPPMEERKLKKESPNGYAALHQLVQDADQRAARRVEGTSLPKNERI